MDSLNPGNIDCDAVLADVYLFLDNEGDAGLRNRIAEHLDACSPCLRHVGLEKDVRALISRCCGGDRAPQSLHDRVRIRITEVTVETSTGVSVETSTYSERRAE